MALDPSHAAFLFFLAFRSALVPLLSEVPLALDLLLELELFFSSVRPPARVRGLASCASCTDLSLVLGGLKSAMVVSVTAFGTSAVGDLSSSDSCAFGMASRFRAGKVAGSDLVETVGEIGVGMAADAGSWDLSTTPLTCRCMSAMSDMNLSSRAAASEEAVAAAVAAVAAVAAASVALFVAIWAMSVVS